MKHDKKRECNKLKFVPGHDRTERNSGRTEGIFLREERALVIREREDWFRSFRFKMLPAWLNDTPFRRKDCRESIFASGSRLALHINSQTRHGFKRITTCCLFARVALQRFLTSKRSYPKGGSGIGQFSAAPPAPSDAGDAPGVSFRRGIPSTPATPSSTARVHVSRDDFVKCHSDDVAEERAFGTRSCPRGTPQANQRP